MTYAVGSSEMRTSGASIYRGQVEPGPLSLGIVIHDFALGGTERIAIRLARAWCELGAAVTIFCGSTEGPLLALLDPRVRIARAPTPIARERGSRRKLARKAAAYFAREPVDGVFVPGNFHWSIIPSLARLPEAVRPVIVAHVSAALDKPQRGWLRQKAFNLRMRYMLRRATSIVTLSNFARDKANAIAGGKRALTIPLPALEDDIAAPLPLPNRKTIVAAGRLVPEKGFRDLIDAFAALNDPVARLVIVGAGPAEQALRARVRWHRMDDRVRFPGYAQDIRSWLDVARIVVLPSHFEGYPAVLVEALAAGRPIVATSCTPATTELLGDAAFGRTVPIRDVAALTEAIRDLLAAPPPDPAALARSVSRHRMKPVAIAYLDLFANLVAAR